MNNEQDISQLIDQYLDGGLEGKALIEFENQLKRDASLTQEVELERVIREAVVDASLLDWKKVAKLEADRLNKLRLLKRIGLWTLLGVSLIGTIFFLLKNDEIKQPENPKQETVVVELEKVKVDQQTQEIEIIDTVKTVEKGLPKIVKQLPKIVIDSVTTNKQVKVNTPKVAVELPTNQQKKEQLPPKQVESTVIDQCEGVAISTTVSTEKTCEGEAEGLLTLTETSGGNPPYSYQINTGRWKTSPNFNNLASGYYSIRIKDVNKCETLLPEEAFVEEKECYQPAAGFNPTYETWEYYGKWPEGAMFTIYDKTGVIIIQKEVNDIFVWNGLNNNGVKVPSGLYVYSVALKNGEVITGSVTVIY